MFGPLHQKALFISELGDLADSINQRCLSIDSVSCSLLSDISLYCPLFLLAHVFESA